MNSVSRPLSLLTIYLGEYLIGFDVTSIQEVLTCQAVRKVPSADSLLHGLINLRGQILTAIELRKFFSLSHKERVEPAMNIVLRDNEDLYGLLVDAVGDVIDVRNEDYVDTPVNISSLIRSCSLGICRIDKKSILVLDTKAVINQIEDRVLGVEESSQVV